MPAEGVSPRAGTQGHEPYAALSLSKGGRWRPWPRGSTSSPRGWRFGPGSRIFA